MDKPTGLVVSGQTDWDAFSHAAAEAYFPHTLTPRGPRTTAADAQLEVTDLGALRIVRLSWGAEVSVHTEHPGAVAINVPLGGELETRLGGRTVVSTAGFATVNPPDTPVAITRWTSGCTILGIKIDRDFLQRELWRVTGRADDNIPEQLDLRGPVAANWIRLVHAIAEQDSSDPLVSHPLVADQLAGSLTDGFLLAAVPPRPDDQQAPKPRIVTRVIDAINADPARPWTAADMASAAGISVRRLQEGFRQYVEKTPRECLTEIRLAGVHSELRSGAVESVTDAALKWGFTHFGRFAAEFRRAYGMAPSQLLRS